MSHSSGNLKHIEEALGGFLTAQQIRSAKQIWQTEFDHHSILVPFAFAKRLAADFSLDRRQTQEVARRLKGRANSSAPKPAAPTRAPIRLTAPGLPDPQVLMDDSTFIFNALLDRILKRLVPAGGGQETLIKSLQQRIPDLKLSESSERLYKQWLQALKNESALLGPGLNEKEMAAIIHSIYLWACNEVGPAADRQISQIIKEVEQLPEALGFGPRKLF